MNKERRAELDRARTMIEGAQSILQQCQDEEQEYYDNMPEALQNGEKGDTAQAAADALSEACDQCDEIMSNIDTASE